MLVHVGEPATATAPIFSARERDVLAVLVEVGEDIRNTAIASRLGITEEGLRYHLRNIYRKTGSRNGRMRCATRSRWACPDRRGHSPSTIRTVRHCERDAPVVCGTDAADRHLLVISEELPARRLRRLIASDSLIRRLSDLDRRLSCAPPAQSVCSPCLLDACARVRDRRWTGDVRDGRGRFRDIKDMRFGCIERFSA